LRRVKTVSRRYSDEFKADVVRAVLDEYRGIEEVSATFDVPSGTFGGWVAQERGLRRQKAELERAKSVMLPGDAAELKSVTMERDALAEKVRRYDKALNAIVMEIADLT
jgi:transposase-like protein